VGLEQMTKQLQPDSAADFTLNFLWLEGLESIKRWRCMNGKKACVEYHIS
jgi:hypothetical protein